MIGAKKGEGGEGFIVGVLLGPFGILFALFSKGDRKTCPHCRELIHRAATVCSHCQRDVGGVPPHSAAQMPSYSPPRQAVQAPPLPPPRVARYFVYLNDALAGSYTLDELKALHKIGDITAETLCCQVGTETWVTYSSLQSHHAA